METFTALKPLVDDVRYHEQRRRYLAELNSVILDPPIAGLIGKFNELSFCFTLQSCFGHFVYNGQRDPYSILPLPVTKKIKTVEYRIAYIAVCVENNDLGRNLIDRLKQIPEIDPGYIQFGCAEWFWDRIVNSYALQVEPGRHMAKDKVSVGYEESLHIEQVRSKFFDRLKMEISKIS